jgi:cation diffusion facilitator CzcD-associated flavoprotein CzcO
MMPSGGEIQQYLRRVADERGIRRHIRFGAEVGSAEYRDGSWLVTTAAGVEEFDVLVTATGFLRVPRVADIPGRESFAGTTFHSARWDHSITLPDKRIGLIGTGSTGVQIIAELGGKVNQLKVFQRTAQWVYPFPNLRFTGLRRELIRRFPGLSRPGYALWSLFISSVYGRAPIRPGLVRSYFHVMCWLNLHLSVRDRALKRKLTPKDQAMCKRLVVSGRFYRSVQKSGVDVVTEGIDRIEPRGVVTADGTLHEVDVLVFATGFDARAYVRPMTIVGENGQTLDEVWADGPHAYRSIAVPGFPNLFMLMGPHSPIANQSLVPVAEDQADYAMWWIEQIRAGRVASAAPTETATKRYNDDIKAALPQTIWASGCNSWYIGKDGLPEVFPWHPGRHRELLRGPVVADFEVRNLRRAGAERPGDRP